MDIYDYAMKMEKDGENYYRDLAQKTTNAGLKRILTMLAGAEVKHYNLFQSMKKNEGLPDTDTEILANVKNVFIKMWEEKETSVDVSQTELYRKAQGIEKQSRDFYLAKANEVEASKKAIFVRIADEEKKHYFILENIIDFVSRPEMWLENPEWYHLEEY
ncbi:MAG: ferritin family protein [Nitrospirae bacterium]|nr:ferritin family protein [Nitrospirota bacterium]